MLRARPAESSRVTFLPQAQRRFRRAQQARRRQRLRWATRTAQAQQTARTKQTPLVPPASTGRARRLTRSPHRTPFPAPSRAGKRRELPSRRQQRRQPHHPESRWQAACLHRNREGPQPATPLPRELALWWAELRQRVLRGQRSIRSTPRTPQYRGRALRPHYEPGQQASVRPEPRYEREG